MKPMERRKDEYILSQSLQVLVENAVKHNAMNQHEKLTIIVERKENMLVVIITSFPLLINQTIPSYKLGLDNLAKRYFVKFGEEIRVKQTSELFTVYLPIVNQG